MSEQRYVTLWRKPNLDFLDWDSHVSESKEDAVRVVDNIKTQGVRQYVTYPIGERVSELSSRF